MTICFDMDGTIFDLYGVENWLDYLIAENPLPYEVAKPMVNFSRLARYIHKAQAKGHKVEIISWLSKNSTDNYDIMVTEAKRQALVEHLPSVIFDNVYIVPYGTPKSEVTNSESAILFDDEERNRNEWTKGDAYSPDMIFEVLKELIA